MQERAPVVHVQVRLPGLDVAVYPVIVAPPVELGAVHDTTLCALAAPVAVTRLSGGDGTPGVVLGVTELDASDALPVPLALVAVTVNV